MSGVIFLIQDNGQLMEMHEKEYDSENLLQTLLARYPNLLAGDQINDAVPRQWLLVSREASLPSEEGEAGRWAVDHLFLDQDAVPTLVEVKRSADTRIRREVIGQMLDYAANAMAYWPMEVIRAQFEATCQVQGLEAEQVLTDFLGPEANQEEFWERVKTNLQAGKIRLIFVADKIPPELRRVVEFLNEQMDPAEVLALEVKQYLGQDPGKELKTLVPKIIGLTAAGQRKKTSAGAEAGPWDEAKFFQVLEARRGVEEAKVARKILDWARQRGLRISWGKGKIDGSFFPMLDYQNQAHWTFAVWTYGRVQTQFQVMQKSAAFKDEHQRLELLQRLNEIPGVSLPPDSITKYPSLPLSALKDEAALARFLEAYDWVIHEIKSASTV